MIICPPAKLSQASSRQNMLQTLDSSAAELWKISDMPLIPFPISERASKLVSHSRTHTASSLIIQVSSFTNKQFCQTPPLFLTISPQITLLFLAAFLPNVNPHL